MQTFGAFYNEFLLLTTIRVVIYMLDPVYIRCKQYTNIPRNNRVLQYTYVLLILIYDFERYVLERRPV